MPTPETTSAATAPAAEASMPAATATPAAPAPEAPKAKTPKAPKEKPVYVIPTMDKDQALKFLLTKRPARGRPETLFTLTKLAAEKIVGKTMKAVRGEADAAEKAKLAAEKAAADKLVADAAAKLAAEKAALEPKVETPAPVAAPVAPIAHRSST